MIAQNQNSALHHSALNGHIAVVDMLLKTGAFPNIQNLVFSILKSLFIPLIYFCSSHPQKGETPLFLACREGHFEVVQLLVEGGAEVDKLNDEGQCALKVAKTRHIKDLLLVSIGNVSSVICIEHTVLHCEGIQFYSFLR